MTISLGVFLLGINWIKNGKKYEIKVDIPGVDRVESMSYDELFEKYGDYAVSKYEDEYEQIYRELTLLGTDDFNDKSRFSTIEKYIIIYNYLIKWNFDWSFEKNKKFSEFILSDVRIPNILRIEFYNKKDGRRIKYKFDDTLDLNNKIKMDKLFDSLMKVNYPYKSK